MYDFKHQFHKRPYFNSYQTFAVSSNSVNIYQQIKNTLNDNKLKTINLKHYPKN